jgi:hypothetical protein
MDRRARVAALVAAGLGLAGCGGGGSSTSSTSTTTTYTRGVPVSTSLSGGATLSLPGGGDDYLLILANNDDPSGTATVTSNSGTTVLPPLATDYISRGRAALSQTARARRPAPRARTAVPAVGSVRTFYLVEGSSPTTTATLMAVGNHTLVYLDNTTPSGTFTSDDITDLETQFDTYIYPTVISNFGPVPDVDGTGHVILLLTPSVVTYGYFYAGDLTGGGNDAEMIYCVTPKASLGTTYASLRVGLLATLAHELEHIVIYNCKNFLHSVGPEEVWLDEGLAFNAEQVCGYLDDPGGPPERVFSYFQSPESYTIRQLSEPAPLVLVGVGYLFVRYLGDRFGQTVFGQLEQSNAIGESNVSDVTGVPYTTLVLDAAAAFYLNGTGLNSASKYAIPSFNTRTSYGGGATEGQALTLTGPLYTTVDASSGAPAFSASFAAGGLRYLRLKNVPSGGASLSLKLAAGSTGWAEVIRLPSTAP